MIFSRKKSDPKEIKELKEKLSWSEYVKKEYEDCYRAEKRNNHKLILFMKGYLFAHDRENVEYVIKKMEDLISDTKW